MSNWRRADWSEVYSNLTRGMTTPAWTRTSRRPQLSTTSWTTWLKSSAIAGVQAAEHELRAVLPRSRRGRRLSSSILTSVAQTFAPAWPRARAIPQPNPWAAPVTRATLPSSLMFWLPFLEVDFCVVGGRAPTRDAPTGDVGDGRREEGENGPTHAPPWAPACAGATKGGGGREKREGEDGFLLREDTGGEDGSPHPRGHGRGRWEKRGGRERPHPCPTVGPCFRRGDERRRGKGEDGGEDGPPCPRGHGRAGFSPE